MKKKIAPGPASCSAGFGCNFSLSVLVAHRQDHLNSCSYLFCAVRLDIRQHTWSIISKQIERLIRGCSRDPGVKIKEFDAVRGITARTTFAKKTL